MISKAHRLDTVQYTGATSLKSNSTCTDIVNKTFIVKCIK